MEKFIEVGRILLDIDGNWVLCYSRMDDEPVIARGTKLIGLVPGLEKHKQKFLDSMKENEDADEE